MRPGFAQAPFAVLEACNTPPGQIVASSSGHMTLAGPRGGVPVDSFCPQGRAWSLETGCGPQGLPGLPLVAAVKSTARGAREAARPRPVVGQGEVGSESNCQPWVSLALDATGSAGNGYKGARYYCTLFTLALDGLHWAFSPSTHGRSPAIVPSLALTHPQACPVSPRATTGRREFAR